MKTLGETYVNFLTELAKDQGVKPYLEALRGDLDSVLATVAATSVVQDEVKTEQERLSFKNYGECLIYIGLHGATPKDLIAISGLDYSVSSITQALKADPEIVAMPGGRYVHAGCFVDLDVARHKLCQILEAQFALYDGYSNAMLLFEKAMFELDSFLNRNDCNSRESVFALAKYFFDKRSDVGKKYVFRKPHIFISQPDYPMNTNGLLVHHARKHDGVLTAQGLKDYLQKIRITCGSLTYDLELNTEKTFLTYDTDKYLFSEKLNIDDAWCGTVRTKLEKILNEGGKGYIALLTIGQDWMDTLPKLPGNLRWTTLLLQDVVGKFTSVGFRPIRPRLTWSYCPTVAFVPNNSLIKKFADIVVKLVAERYHSNSVSFSASNLKSFLSEMKLLPRNLVWNSSVNLAISLKDSRFIWTGNEENVIVICN